MIRLPIDYDLSGHSYNPENPTEQSEALCFRLNAILDAAKTEGFELRQTEDSDIIDSESHIAEMFAQVLVPPEEPLPCETPVNDEMLFDGAIYEAINKARVAWLEKINSAILEGEPVPDSLAAINETLKLMLTQETVLYLSDGTPIYGKLGLVA